jgi:peptidoglycan hydrolase-like protein with peptidoglycan-binding domain
LKNDGVYSGKIDGIDGPMTRAAIRKYQSTNNLAVNGRLDQQTRASLGLQTSGEANRSNNNSSNQSANTSSSQDHGNMTSTSTVEAAQRQLHEKGMYNGAIDGKMDRTPRLLSANIKRTTI